MNSLRNLTSTFLILSAILAPLMTTAQKAAVPPAKATKPVLAATHTADDAGQRAWNANCSRCHNAPETLNPRITGTVVRHMRVRANLSAADEREILRFLNP